MNGIQVAEATCRFLQDGSALLLWGVFAYLTWLAPQGLADILDQRLRPALRLSVALVVLSTAAQLPLHAAEFGQGWAFSFDTATLGPVLFQTRLGEAWQYQALAAALLAASSMLPNRSRRPTTAAAAALLLGSLSLTGHAVIPTGPWGIAHRVADTLHLLCGGAWLGALPPLLITLGVLRQADHRAEAITALRRFSIAGHGAVACVIATGVFNAWLILAEEKIDPGSTYQRLLVCKMLLVAAMTGLALCNRYWWVPRLKLQAARALRMMVWMTAAEIALGSAAVALVSVFGLLSPG